MRRSRLQLVGSSVASLAVAVVGGIVYVLLSPVGAAGFDLADGLLLGIVVVVALVAGTVADRALAARR